jgi:hypothetical protein
VAPWIILHGWNRQGLDARGGESFRGFCALE